MIEFPDEAALSRYLQDPVRMVLARTHDREAIIARTQALRCDPPETRTEA